MRILLTNDDGIGAKGLQTLRRELRQIEGVTLDVIAPDSNRSASARSITTRTPLSVEEIHFDDGDLGHATDGTPVDCVRFAQVGLLGEKPDLIVSGINHGLNLGDDVTYSGTVAAALEGILLGLPAVAVSQQSEKGEMGYMPQRHYEFDTVAKFTAGLVREMLDPTDKKLGPESLSRLYASSATLRECNRQHAKSIAGALPEASRADFQGEVLRRSYPRTFAPSNFDRALAAARVMTDLSDAQKGKVEALGRDYERDPRRGPHHQPASP